MVEEMLGKIRYESKQSGNKHIREENLMNADRIRRMEADQALCVTSNEEPLLIETIPSFRNAEFSRLMKLPPYPLPPPLPSEQLRFVPL